MHMWQPYAEIIDDLPPGVTVHVYDGTQEPPPDAAETEFYVLPYTFDRTPLTMLARMPKLTTVQTLTAGYEHVLPHLPPGVALHNAGGVHDASTAELAVGLMIASLRGFPEFVQGQLHGEWRHARFEALADKTVLILGYGGVGSAVDRRLGGFEVEVIRVARTARSGVHAAAELPTLLPKADVVVLCLPLTQQTRNIVDREFLSLMPDGALLVNVSRGGLVNTESLIAECAAGRLRAALDVTDPEPPDQGSALWSTAGILLTPHVGGNSSAFLPRARELILAQTRRFVAGEQLLYRVDLDPEQS